VFWGSFLTYANSAKESLGVPAELLRKHGAVSAEAAISLAENGMRKMSAAVRDSRPLACIATTGIAGPSGGSAEKPIGLCHLALARSGRPTVHREILAPRTPIDQELRLANKSYFAYEAIELVLTNA
jgi:nicotinamide-nucleotide amidase